MSKVGGKSVRNPGAFIFMREKHLNAIMKLRFLRTNSEVEHVVKQ